MTQIIIIVFIVSFIGAIISIRSYNKKREKLRINEEEQEEAIIDLEEQVNEDISLINNTGITHIDTSNMSRSDFGFGIPSSEVPRPEPPDLMAKIEIDKLKYVGSIDPYAKDVPEAKIMIGKIIDGVFQAKVIEERKDSHIDSMPENMRQYPLLPSQVKEYIEPVNVTKDSIIEGEVENLPDVKETQLEHGEEDVLKLLLTYLKEGR